MYRPLLLALALPALAAGPALAGTGAPYPTSNLGITWNTGTYRFGGVGGDIWPVTAAAGGQPYTAWGDGTVGCGRYVSYGTATLPAAPAAVPRTIGCGPAGSGHDKIGSLLATGRALYAIAYLQSSKRLAIWRSGDGGRSWFKPSWTFPDSGLLPDTFVQYGAGNAGAPGGYAYLTAVRPRPALPRAIYLMRAPVGGLEDPGAYRYLAGGGTWTADPARARPVFADPRGVNTPVMAYDRGLHVFLLTAGHGNGAGQLGVFEAPTPEGPWRTIAYEERWLGMGAGPFLGLGFPTRWTSADGRTLWAVFNGGAGSRYHDRLNIMQAVLR